jgi:hypothetical protein
MSIINTAIIEIYTKGYRAVNGQIFSPFDNNNPLKLSTKSKTENSIKYYVFSVYCKTARRACTIPVHRFVAFQKFGKEIFNTKLHVRHKDSNSMNNHEDNIILGTPSQNAYDKPAHVRKAMSIHAAKHNRKFDDATVNEIKNKRGLGYTYKKLMELYDITSLGTMSYIINTDYATTI